MGRRTTIRSAVAAVALVGVVVAGVGCGDDDGDDVTGGDTTAASEETAAETPSTDEEPAEPLVAAFSYDVDLGSPRSTSCPAVGIELTDESEGDPEAWLWEFADGTTSEEQHPQRDVGPDLGEEVTLTVTRGDETDSVTEEVDYPVC